MKNKSKKLLFALLLSCSVVMVATGCDKLKKEPETEKQTEAPETEPPTEEPETEPPTETESETESETETEPQTQSETQPQELPLEQEQAQETEFDQLRTMYAMDDINVRTAPGKDGEIFDSFDQGEQITVVGETPNWYKVNVDDYEIPGYVSKQFMSESEVAPKTEEERAQLAAQGAGETVSGTDASTESASSSNTASSASDAEYGVETYAESFPIQATTGANMRNTPAQDGEIIETIASGTNVTAIGYTDRWYKVEYNGTVGYVNKNLFASE